jgi:hypothetical protein
MKIEVNENTNNMSEKKEAFIFYLNELLDNVDYDMNASDCVDMLERIKDKFITEFGNE